VKTKAQAIKALMDDARATARKDTKGHNWNKQIAEVPLEASRSNAAYSKHFHEKEMEDGYAAQQVSTNYLSARLGHRVVPKPGNQPDLCSADADTFQSLTPPQRAASDLLQPGGPLKQLLMQLPPGAGKTCAYLEVMVKFLNWQPPPEASNQDGFSVVVIGDKDIWTSFNNDLAKCPAKIRGTGVLFNQDGTNVNFSERMLRDLEPKSSITPGEANKNKVPSNWWKLASQPPRPSTAAGGKKAPRLEDKKMLGIDEDSPTPKNFYRLGNGRHVFFLDYREAGAWLKTIIENDPEMWSKYINPAGKSKTVGKGKTSHYHYFPQMRPGPNGPRVLMIFDEVQKLCNPSEERVTSVGNWKTSVHDVAAYLRLRPFQENFYILAGTATINTTSFPTLSVCLPFVLKGRSIMFSGFEDGDKHRPIIDEAIQEFDLYSFLDVQSGYVDKVSEIYAGRPLVSARRLEAAKFSKPEEIDVEEAAERITRLQGWDNWIDVKTMPKAYSTSTDKHACPTDKKDRNFATRHIYKLRKDNDTTQKIIQWLWKNLVFAVNTTADRRFFPARHEPYPTIRAVEATAPWIEQAKKALRAVSAKGPGWLEISQYNDTAHLNEILREGMETYMTHGGTEPAFKRGDISDILQRAPKWQQMIDDLKAMQGKTFVYLGSRDSGHVFGCHYSLLFMLVVQSLFFDKEGGKHKMHFYLPQFLDDKTRQKLIDKQSPVPLFIYPNLKEDANAKPAKKKDKLTWEDHLANASTTIGRTQALANFNALCGPFQSSTRSAILCMDSEGYKAVDLKCASNALIGCPQTAGRFQQTQGRVARRCTFKPYRKDMRDSPNKLAEADKNYVYVYLLTATDAFSPDSVVLDPLLYAFYKEQSKILRDLEELEISAAIGCSNWIVYSDWKNYFQNPNFKCVADVPSTPAPSHPPSPPQRQDAFFRFDVHTHRIIAAPCGDISEHYVFASASQQPEEKSIKIMKAHHVASERGIQTAVKKQLLRRKQQGHDKKFRDSLQRHVLGA